MTRLLADRRGSAVLLVIWMTGILAVLVLGFTGRVGEASIEVQAAQARLKVDAAIDAALAAAVQARLSAPPGAAPWRSGSMTIDEVRLYVASHDESGLIDVNTGDVEAIRRLIMNAGGDDTMAERAVDLTSAARGRGGDVASADPGRLAFLNLAIWADRVGLPPDLAGKVLPNLTTFSQKSAVDLTQAPLDVLRALPSLTAQQVETLERARRTSPQALQDAVAALPAAGDGEDAGQGAQGDQQTKVRYTIEAIVDGVLHKSERIVVAFREASGSGTGDYADDVGAEPEPAQASAPKAPYAVLDRQELTVPAGLETALAPPRPGAAPP